MLPTCVITYLPVALHGDLECACHCVLSLTKDICLDCGLFLLCKCCSWEGSKRWSWNCRSSSKENALLCGFWSHCLELTCCPWFTTRGPIKPGLLSMVVGFPCSLCCIFSVTALCLKVTCHLVLDGRSSLKKYFVCKEGVGEKKSSIFGKIALLILIFPLLLWGL